MNQTMSNYRPLPDCLTIKESSIEGLGLFATEDIPKGTHLGRAHYSLPDLMTIVRTPLGGFYNHSENPNCQKYWEYEEPNTEIRWSQLVASEDIKAGDEITCKYELYNIDDDE